jgi:hypothetical protein
MKSVDVLVDAYTRVHGVVHRATDGLTSDELAVRIDPGANSIGWLIWHLSRIQDDHIADVAARAQVYVSGDWWQRLGRPFAVGDTGYAHSSDQVGALRFKSPSLLVDYFDAVHEQTITYVRGLTDEDLDRVVDTNWDPVVTLGVRLVSVISDSLQHAGQAAFVRGSIERP